MYGEEDVDPEDGAAVMSDKITYSFDDILSQVQVYKRGLLSEFARVYFEQSCLWVCVLSICLSVCMAVCVFLSLHLCLPISQLAKYLQHRLMASSMQRPVTVDGD